MASVSLLILAGIKWLIYLILYICILNGWMLAKLKSDISACFFQQDAGFSYVSTHGEDLGALASFGSHLIEPPGSVQDDLIDYFADIETGQGPQHDSQRERGEPEDLCRPCQGQPLEAEEADGEAGARQPV